MSNLPSERLYIQTESVVTRAPVSENLMQTISGSVNALLDQTFLMDFRMNGHYAGFAGEQGFDGIVPFRKNCEIMEVFMYNDIPGSSGTTEVDILYTPSSANTWTSIFSQRPAIQSTAPSYSYVGTNFPSGFCVQPIMTSTPFQVVAGGALRFDVISTMAGSPKNMGIVIYFRERN